MVFCSRWNISKQTGPTYAEKYNQDNQYYQMLLSVDNILFGRLLCSPSHLLFLEKKDTHCLMAWSNSNTYFSSLLNLTYLDIRALLVMSLLAVHVFCPRRIFTNIHLICCALGLYLFHTLNTCFLLYFSYEPCLVFVTLVQILTQAQRITQNGIKPFYVTYHFSIDASFFFFFLMNWSNGIGVKLPHITGFAYLLFLRFEHKQAFYSCRIWNWLHDPSPHKWEYWILTTKCELYRWMSD